MYRVSLPQLNVVWSMIAKLRGWSRSWVVQLRFPLEDLRLAQRRPKRQAPGTEVIVPRLPELDRGRILLSRIGSELLEGQRAGQILLAVREAEVEPNRGPLRQDVPEGCIGASANLLA